MFASEQVAAQLFPILIGGEVKTLDGNRLGGQHLDYGLAWARCRTPESFARGLGFNWNNQRKEKSVMKTLMLLSLLPLFISGCATVPIPMADMIGTFETNKKIEKKVLLIFPVDFNKRTYCSKQLATTFTYALGYKTENYIEEAFRGHFSKVDKSTDDANKGLYDLVIKPELVNFRAEVPATIFQPTATQVDIKLDVLEISQNKELVITGYGSQKVVTDEERKYRNEKLRNAPKLHVQTPNFMIDANKYENIAASDAELAFLHCLNNLMGQLVTKLNLNENKD